MATILIIDDQPIMQKLMQTMLEFAGHQTVVAGSREEALAVRSGRAVHAVVADLFLPGAGDAAAAGRYAHGGSRLPMIAVAGGSEREPGEFKRLASEFGADRLLRKAFPVQQLTGQLAELLGRAA